MISSRTASWWIGRTRLSPLLKESFSCLIIIEGIWRVQAESNRPARFCGPVPNLSAMHPGTPWAVTDDGARTKLLTQTTNEAESSRDWGPRTSRHACVSCLRLSSIPSGSIFTSCHCRHLGLSFSQTDLSGRAAATARPCYATLRLVCWQP